jgi:hypothetical protein
MQAELNNITSLSSGTVVSWFHSNPSNTDFGHQQTVNQDDAHGSQLAGYVSF